MTFLELATAIDNAKTLIKETQVNLTTAMQELAVCQAEYSSREAILADLMKEMQEMLGLVKQGPTDDSAAAMKKLYMEGQAVRGTMKR